MSTYTSERRPRRPRMECLSCGSWATFQRGRALHCQTCETSYLIPAADLAAQVRTTP